MKIVMLALAMSFACSGAALAAPATAPKMVLQLRPLMCPATNDLVLYWARRSTGIASFAAATVLGPLAGECAKRPQAMIGYSRGAASPQEADSMALAKCAALNAGNTRVGPCIIVGRLRVKPAN